MYVWSNQVFYSVSGLIKRFQEKMVSIDIQESEYRTVKRTDVYMAE